MKYIYKNFSLIHLYVINKVETCLKKLKRMKNEKKRKNKMNKIEKIKKKLIFSQNFICYCAGSPPST